MLTDAEIDRLDRFLLDRIDETADTLGKDEGILDIAELDGFLTAVVSGPVMIPPSQWLPAVWGDFAPLWKDEKEFESVFTLMIRHMNDIATTLMERPQDFEPIFMQRVVEGKTYTIVDEWCEGYYRGMKLAADAWETGGGDMEVLLVPILAFTEVTKWRGHDFNQDEIENLQMAVTENARIIHAYWLQRRMVNAPASAPVRREKPQVGRNDPCPCGSGKKYKKCCLH
ncbi:MAG: UPF0149 family protein [Gammaproteobacteria bacterium]